MRPTNRFCCDQALWFLFSWEMHRVQARIEYDFGRSRQTIFDQIFTSLCLPYYFTRTHTTARFDSSIPTGNGLYRLVVLYFAQSASNKFILHLDPLFLVYHMPTLSIAWTSRFCQQLYTGLRSSRRHSDITNWNRLSSWSDQDVIGIEVKKRCGCARV